MNNFWVLNMYWNVMQQILPVCPIHLCVLLSLFQVFDCLGLSLLLRLAYKYNYIYSNLKFRARQVWNFGPWNSKFGGFGIFGFLTNKLKKKSLESGVRRVPWPMESTNSELQTGTLPWT